MTARFATLRRCLPIAMLATAALLAIPTIASARPTANLIANPSFENGFRDWSAWGGSGWAGPSGDARDGKNVGGATSWMFNTQMTVSSAWQHLDGRAVAGDCTASARIRAHGGTVRTGYLVLTERNGLGMVYRQYTSPRVTLTKAFQEVGASGHFVANSGSKLEVSIVVNGVNFWGGDAFAVDDVDVRCKAVAPLQVHLGDSYSSGAGAETTPTLNGRTIDNSVAERIGIINQIHPCYRTSNSAAHVLGDALGGHRVRDWSCAGAKTENILNKPQIIFEPQIRAVTADADLVTLTIGGNDAALLNILFCAMQEAECTKDSAPIAQSYGLLEATRTGLRNTLAEITRRAPNAEVRLANYPYLLPLPGSSSGACGEVVTQGEMQMGKALQDRYAEIVREVVGSLGNAKVRFVDVNAPGSPFNVMDEYGTRDFCSVSPNRWMNGYIDLTVDSRIGIIHPNATGYRYYAYMYLKSLEGIDSVRN